MAESRSETAAPEHAAFATSRDAFLGGRLEILQPKSGPRAAIDALFLAAAVPAEQGRAQRVLEAGTGTGIAALALCARVGDVQVTGVEVQAALLALAQENAQHNGMDDRATFLEADIASMGKARERAGLSRESFDHVMANPPYFTEGAARPSPDPSRAKAYGADTDALDVWARFLATMARPGGTATAIHRAEALNSVLSALGGRFGGLTVFPLYPRGGEPAKRIIVQGVKGSRAPLRLLSGMALHVTGGGYTREADAVLRGGAGLDFGIKSK